MKRGTTFSLEINPKLPAKLARLNDLARDLWYSWDKPTRTLFARLNPKLWSLVGHNPVVFLRRLEQKALDEAARDHVFLTNYAGVLSSFDTYHREPAFGPYAEDMHKNGDLVAYFCAEFGFHESFPIYSGGLGILAGDHCKAASDLNIPFVAVGLLYRQGYFSQFIDGEGNQIATYNDSDFADLPIDPARDEHGNEVRISVDFPGREVIVRVWRAKIGQVWLYLLDTDVAENSLEDRNITHKLYGGDRHTRITQELVLGIGGARALHRLGLKPTIWHINEGHAAFMILERVRMLVAEGLSFTAALEATAVNTVFTTHTPVPAGHDYFSQEMINEFLSPLYAELGITRAQFMALGLVGTAPDFNMTSLAIRGSRHQNGVSQIHGTVSAEICAEHWSQLRPQDNPITYVTNGVHVSTFLAEEWSDMFDNFFGYEWRHRLCDVNYWECINDIPDVLFWGVHQALKAQMLHRVRTTISAQHVRNGGSPASLDRHLKYLDHNDANILTIGFARRFATYKRAALIFEDLDWLRRLMSDAQRPIVFIFAGKAHPADRPGQDLFRQIHAISRMPEFEGKVLLVEGYDMSLARKLVSGVDVWLNNPVYPLEASGTSGMKAGLNGVINLSVLDGWWGESYDGQNGWAIKPAPQYLDDYKRNKEDSQSLYELLEDQVIPMYYERSKMGFSSAWVAYAKRSIATILPRFNAHRMVDEYVERIYLPASRQGRRYFASAYAGAKTLASWKVRVQAAWERVAIVRLDNPVARIDVGASIQFEVAVDLNGLEPEDVLVEMVISRATRRDESAARHYRFEYAGPLQGSEHRFALHMTPDLCGRLDYRIRVYPYHELLTHPYELGLMVWL